MIETFWGLVRKRELDFVDCNRKPVGRALCFIAVNADKSLQVFCCAVLLEKIQVTGFRDKYFTDWEPVFA